MTPRLNWGHADVACVILNGNTHSDLEIIFLATILKSMIKILDANFLKL